MLVNREDAAPPDRLPRQFGRYTLLEELARGGLGVVYRAVPRGLGDPVALKVLRRRWSGKPGVRERLARGARCASRVDHENALKVLEHGEVDGEPYLAMGLLDGRSLEDLLKELRLVDAPRFRLEHHDVLDRFGVPGVGLGTLSYARRVAALLAGPVEALAACHDAGFVHRDVKPSNLLFDGRGRLVLADFDLVRERRGPRTSDAPVGTLRYMSPERWEFPAEELDGRTDLYAVGAVLHELLTLRPVYEEEAPGDLIRSVRAGRASDPGGVVRELPARVRTLVIRCLARDREQRPASGWALARALRRLSGSDRPRKRA
jgi:serine/threonine-protein kinase